MSEEAPLLNDEADHPHDVVLEHSQGRVVAMDSARYVESRNEGLDVVVPSSYLGVLPARLIAPHRPRAGIAHDDSDGAMIVVAFYTKTPKNIVTLGRVIDGSISLGIVTATAIAYFLAAAVVVRN